MDVQGLLSAGRYGRCYYNIVKGGSTVPIKFELFKGTTGPIQAYINQPLQATKISCTTGVGTDDIELTATGGAEPPLRHHGWPVHLQLEDAYGHQPFYKVTITDQTMVRRRRPSSSSSSVRR